MDFRRHVVCFQELNHRLQENQTEITGVHSDVVSCKSELELCKSQLDTCRADLDSCKNELKELANGGTQSFHKEISWPTETPGGYGNIAVSPSYFHGPTEDVLYFTVGRVCTSTDGFIDEENWENAAQELIDRSLRRKGNDESSTDKVTNDSSTEDGVSVDVGPILPNYLFRCDADHTEETKQHELQPCQYRPKRGTSTAEVTFAVKVLDARGELRAEKRGIGRRDGKILTWNGARGVPYVVIYSQEV